jgi:23S rRNA (pseudouridine1915-N3)-methyltransferase
VKFKFIAFGKLKNPGLRQAADHYLSFLSSFCEFTEVELRPQPVSEKSEANRKKNQSKEAQTLQAKISTHSKNVLVVLDETGQNWSTKEWAYYLQKFQDQGALEVTFVIGSSIGFSDEIRRQATHLVSLGKQTLSHELTRIVLFEQCARAMSVLKKHPYHHEGS